MVRATARHLIPSNGAYDIPNYLLEDDGSLYKRGGTRRKTTANFGTTGLTFIWSGRLIGGERTVVATREKFGVLNEDGATVYDLGLPGMSRPARGSEVQGVLYLDGGWAYAGARKPVYGTGTVDVTNGSADIGGSGMDWLVNAEAGMFFRVNGPNERWYPVDNIGSGLNAALTEPYEGTTATGVSYTLASIVQPDESADIYAVLGKRLLAMTEGGRTVAFSDWGTPTAFDHGDDHVIPGGIGILGADSIHATALIFTTGGVWAIENMDLDPVDEFGNVQHRLSRVNPALILWGRAGIAAWEDSLIVPGTDGVYLLSGSGQTRRLDLSITPLYRDYVEAGYQPGLATVFRGHYFLPVRTLGNEYVDTLVCRLDRPVQTRLGTIFPWTRLSGDGGDVNGYSVQIGAAAREPLLLGASGLSTGRVLECPYFEPDASVKDDSGEPFTADLVTRDFPTGQGNKNTTRWLSLYYELTDTDEDDDPTIAASVGIGERISGLTEWGGFNWGAGSWADPDDALWEGLTGVAEEEMEGLVPKRWAVNKKARHIRFRLRLSDAAANLVVRGLNLRIRQSTKAD